ncbi:MAG: hypothetical protein ABSG96_02105 [Terracidiphilus sp.]|jgi:hypothetical protein
MKIIPPNSGPVESIGGQTVTGMRLNRRIEITVEREIVSVLVKGRSEASTGEQAWDREGRNREGWERAGPESEPAGLDQLPTGVSDKTNTIHPPQLGTRTVSIVR